MSKNTATASGHALWAKMPKANAELFALTYGSLVTELIRDYDDANEINNQLDRIGHSIGVRCVDEFLSKAEMAGINIPPCTTMRDTAEVVAKIGFRMFLGVTAETSNFSPDGRAFSVFLYDNPLAIFVELPPPPSGGAIASGEKDLSKIKYSNIFCGVIRGALEQVNLRVNCEFVRDVLRGEEVNEIRVELKEVLVDGAGDDYKEE
uniref:Trafficking protein particle complex subunit n=1 Tax=Ditylum brightwellii TaxID=49249 RepID=A0A6V2DC26_9STRA|mmetsp:Transcript_25116/g.33295  ORF Transcript_25116/g.33295 Transcript_25116/m.33295 type:complete len:206 (-) Transcript_25116:381-998(-)